jgi:hypothetical protein
LLENALDLGRLARTLAADMLQDIEPNRGRQVEVRTFDVYVRDELIGREVLLGGNPLEFIPECVFERNARASSVDLYRSFNDVTFHGRTLYTDLSTVAIEVPKGTLCPMAQPYTVYLLRMFSRMKTRIADERLLWFRCLSTAAMSSVGVMPWSSAISFKASQKPSSRVTLVL